MAKYLSLSAIGKDTTGIVSALSGVLYEVGANIEDSTMTILHGQFAVILILKVAPSAQVKLKKLLVPVGKKLGLNIFVSEVKNIKSSKKQLNKYIISVYGADKTGIVYRVTSTLADFGVNILDVQTKVLASAKRKTYLMLIKADLGKTSAATLKEVLNALALEMSINITLNIAQEERL